MRINYYYNVFDSTQPENFLNTIGRVKDDEKSGNILLWKRKAEEFLISACMDYSMKYTIVHPGGLTDKKGELTCAYWDLVFTYSYYIKAIISSYYDNHVIIIII